MEIIKCDYDAINGIADFILGSEDKQNILLKFKGVSKYMFIQSNSNCFDSSIKFFPIEDIIEKNTGKNKEFQLVEKRQNKVFDEFEYNYLIDSCSSCWYINAENVEIFRDLSNSTDDGSMSQNESHNSIIL